MGMEHPVEAALGTDIEPPIRLHRHDLPWRQQHRFRLVAGEQDPLAFLFAQAVRHMAVAALATVDAITVTNKLTAPALQRGEPNAEQQGKLTGSGTIAHTLIKDLQGLPAIVG